MIADISLLETPLANAWMTTAEYTCHDPEKQSRDINSITIKLSAKDMRKRMSSTPYSRILSELPHNIFVSWSNPAAPAASADRA